MPKIEVVLTTNIKAKAENIWKILADVQSWSQWLNTSYVKYDTPGPLVKGSTFFAELGGIRWKLTVIEEKKTEKICWIGNRFGIKAIHGWELLEDGETTIVVSRESMSGYTAIITYPFTKRRLSKYDEKWLADLKTRAEKP